MIRLDRGNIVQKSIACVSEAPSLGNIMVSFGLWTFEMIVLLFKENS